MFNFAKNAFNAVINNAEIATANAEAKGWEVAGDACYLAMDAGVAVAQTAMKAATKAAEAAETCYNKQEEALKWAADVRKNAAAQKEAKEETPEPAKKATKKTTKKAAPKKAAKRATKVVVE